MKKKLVALAALSAIAGVAQAQSSVTLYGIVDAAFRYTTNQGDAADNSASLSKLVGGGMSQSRWGMAINEDLGGGLRAMANLETRFLTDNGANAAIAGGSWSQSWVGLQSSSLGRVTAGRQYNVLFDVVTTTYASFKYSPYVEAYKPEITVSLGARNDNMVKYALTLGGFTGELQVSGSEGAALSGTNPIGGKSVGGMAKYSFGAFGVGGGYLERQDTTGLKVKGYTVGASYSAGPLYISGGYAENKFNDGFNSGYVLGGSGYDSSIAYLTSAGGANPTAALHVDNRSMWFANVNYYVTPALNLGVGYWKLDQSFFTSSSFTSPGSPSMDFFAFIGDYAFSKRTDAYVGLDYTKLKGPISLNSTAGAINNATDRTGFMVGLRHRF
ncbi:MAG: hypothetical protein RLZZ598_901 [Pseudomonadota bacterium]|jgi:predicted porin